MQRIDGEARGEAVTLKRRNLYVHTEVEAVKRVSERERERNTLKD